MITIINGDLIQANQLAEDLGRRWFGAHFYHWHGGDLAMLQSKFKHRNAAIKGMYIANCNEAKTLETLLFKLDKEKLSVIVTTCCTFEEPERDMYSDSNSLWSLKLLCKFTLITIKQY